MQSRVLVVDDAEVNRELLRNILEDEYVVETAQGGEEALQKLQQYAEETAAILLDLQMPGMDGFDMIAAIRQNGWLNSIPVLVISS